MVTRSRGTSSVADAMSMPTRLACATWPASARSPSETSIIAVAPASAATCLRALIGGRGRRASVDQDPRVSGTRGPAPPDHRPPSPAARGARRRRPAARRSAAPGTRCRRRGRSPPRVFSEPATSPPTMPAPTSAHSRRTRGRSRGPSAPAASAAPANPTVSHVRPAAHGVDVGEVLRGGPVADVDRARPSPCGSAGPRPSGRSRPRRARCGPAARPRRRRDRPARRSPGATSFTIRATWSIRPNSPRSARVTSGAGRAAGTDPIPPDLAWPRRGGRRRPRGRLAS